MDYFPRENPGEGFGVGIFPLLEVPGATTADKINFPASYSLESELCSAMQAALPLSTINKEEFGAVWSGASCPAVNGTLRCKWPSPGKNLANKKKAGNGNSSTGKVVPPPDAVSHKLKLSRGHCQHTV